MFILKLLMADTLEEELDYIHPERFIFDDAGTSLIHRNKHSKVYNEQREIKQITCNSIIEKLNNFVNKTNIRKMSLILTR